METTITILVDNTAGGRRGTIAEHGLSVWISQGEEHTLFDTGAGKALPINIECMKKNLQNIHRVILSHGHWDHTGGLKEVLGTRDTIDVLAHPGIFEERFAVRKQNGKTKYYPASIPFSQKELEQAGAHFLLKREYHEVSPGLWFSGEIPRPQGWQSSDHRLVIKRNKEDIPDPLVDDISLLLETDSGPVVLLGCAHAGTDIILDYLSDKSGYSSFYAVIGGTHLMRSNDQQIDTIITILEKYQVQKIVATHCTGFPAMAKMYYHFGDRFEVAHVGSVFRF
jgi:7,8-dihydropterin-6-yl-methyl-4-(beta-D-ribofuranosyl)aminobenzene 5'-phosphate synthase